ncbi:MAG: DNA polymerase IV [Cytophagales bacterium CG12_big_fil_rev_8_21_14_0_65_40_12]|nr:MAG: DNA polymerase IV [Cytophagales bacterium CG12_big_fil_rev_8_21_14_0_65_40_12]PIW02900.1 MAG: DNA polymerase IV [Cytophagales bacterium CG17_big_fil_post_rev_8_21_14_2_50_40_13]
MEEKLPESLKKIIHIDMDAFFASVEQLDFPEYRGKPLAVGGSKDRGVVAAASYEARKYGVYSAMPSKTAYQKCPHIIFTPPRFERYKEVSSQIQAIFHEYTDLVEPLSLDEAYLDVTENKKGIPSATLIAKAIRKEIKEKTGLTASAGISINKFLAKIASDYQKPDGITLIGPEKALSFLEKLEIDKFFGVGKVTAKKMHALGIHTGADLKEWSKERLILKFGKSGGFYYNIVRGEDSRTVNPNRIRKSLGAENTFDVDIIEIEDMKMALDPILQTVHRRLEKAATFGKTLTLKVKFKDFSQITRSVTKEEPIADPDLIKELTFQLLEQIQWDDFPTGVRLLGVTNSNFEHDEEEKPKTPGYQLTLDF